MVVEQGLILWLRITNQSVVKFIGPDAGEMLIHQMRADTDIERAHEHFLLTCHCFIVLLCAHLLFLGQHHFRHINHGGVGDPVPVHILLCKGSLQLNPEWGTIRIDHGQIDRVPFFPACQTGFYPIRKHFPPLRVGFKVPVALVLKTGFVLSLGITNQLIIVAVGPDAGKVLIHKVLTDTGAQNSHQHTVFVIELLIA